MQKIMCIHGTNLESIQKDLLGGWKVVSMTSFSQPVSVSCSHYVKLEGNYGAFVVLEKELEKDETFTL